MAGIDWNRVRRDFPAAERFRYFAAASGSPIARPVYEKAIQYYQDLLDFGDHHWRQNLAKREEARNRLAELINAEPDEVEFVTSTSAGMNILAAMLVGEGDVITSTLEFPSTTLPWLHARPESVRWIRPDSRGVVSVKDFQNRMSSTTGTLLTSHVQFSNGLRQDLTELGAAKGDHYFVVNGTQAMGAFEVDVKAMRIDALCCNSYKWLMSGYGCGFLYVSRKLTVDHRPPAVGWFGVEQRNKHRNDGFDLLSSAERYNLGSPPFPTILALGASLEYMQGIGMANIQARVLQLNRYLTSRLDEIGVEVLSPRDPEKYRSGQTLVRLENPSATVSALEKQGILCTEKPEGMRVATHFFVNEGDIDSLVEVLRTLVTQ